MTAEVVIGVSAVAVSLATYLISSNRDRRIRRADLVRALTKDFYERPAIAEVFMAIDHAKFNIDREFVGSEREMALIQFLDLLNAVGHNWARGVLPMEDLMHTTLGYATLRAYCDPAVAQYLRLVDHWDQERFVSEQGFHYFRQLGKELEVKRQRQEHRNRGRALSFRAKKPVDPARSETSDDP